jgi:YggT family protein
LQVLYDLVGNVATPIMRPIRRAIPPLRLGRLAVDLSPVVALFALSLGRSVLLVLIASLVSPVVG